ncbi:MAG: NfeD family protein [Planctomycetales bacterium]|nr:NfeD family protein [Planctomycetales bacterium]
MGYLEPWVWAVVLLAIGLALLLAEIMLPTGGAVGALALAAVAAAVGLGFYHYGFVGGVSLFLASSVAIPIAIGLGLWALPRTPIGRRLLLGDPMGPSDEEDYSPDAIRARHELIGRIGVAKSLMLPSGAVEIDGRSYDAATDAEAIEAGEPVRVIDVQTGRLVVRRYTGPAAAELSEHPDDPLSRSIEELGIDDVTDEFR